MIAIKCEMCGSNSLLKKDGVYVCEHCGTKYTVEEAKKLMIEISGTVKIDDTDEVNNLYSLARRTKNQANFSEAGGYYRSILLHRPNDWEAIFYSYYGDVYASCIDEVAGITSNLCNNIDCVFDNLPTDNKQKEYINEMLIACVNMSDMVSRAARNFYNHYPDAFNAKRDYAMKVTALLDLLYKVSERAEMCGVIATNTRKAAAEVFSTNFDVLFAEPVFQEYMKLAEANVIKIRETEPKYKVSGACYIATAVYGSYDCPEVWTLRRFRDDILGQSVIGKIFIQIYYFLSPILVKTLGSNKLFKNIGRKYLDVFVQWLKGHGISDMPYQDKDW